jgi:2-polyprenyl-3-methyl-5-hydroxy-6-metoxy-1,4-benzoquinol methylase
MRFQITLNMPSFSGNSVHQVIGDYPVNSLEDFIKEMDRNDFIIVNEMYRHAETKQFYEAGEVAINPMIIGKVKIWK